MSFAVGLVVGLVAGFILTIGRSTRRSTRRSIESCAQVEAQLETLQARLTRACAARDALQQRLDNLTRVRCLEGPADPQAITERRLRVVHPPEDS